MKKKLYNIGIIITITLSGLVLSCKDDTIIEPIEFSEIEDLVSSFQGNRESSIVIVNTQGGPVTTTEDDFVTEIMNNTETTNVLWVNVHQAQTAYPPLFTNTDISFEQAKTYDAESIEKLKTVITYFKEERNKTVYVLGISFGAFMTQELIATHGIDVADKYLIMVGRLNIEEELWMAFSNGQGGGYTYNEEGNPTIVIEDLDELEDRNMSRLAAGLGYNRYITKLNDISSLSKITYVFGDRDEQVGPLTTEEATFLINKGASVLFVENGDHSESIDAGLVELKSIFDLD